jgi:hypothetical protein
MADLVLYASNIYLAIAVLAVAYRAYGIGARTLARRAAHNALKKLRVARVPDDGVEALRLTVADIFSDQRVLEEEFDRFAEVAIASYIAEKDKTIRLLRHADLDQDIEIRVLGYLLHNTLKDRAYLEGIVARISADAHTSLFGDAMVNLFARHRLEGFAVEFSDLVATDFSVAPKRVGIYVDAPLLDKIVRRNKLNTQS